MERTSLRAGVAPGESSAFRGALFQQLGALSGGRSKLRCDGSEALQTIVVTPAASATGKFVLNFQTRDTSRFNSFVGVLNRDEVIPIPTPR